MKPWLDTFNGNSVNELILLEQEFRIESLIISLEERLLLKESHSSQEDVVLSLCEFDRQVNNGGFHQYLTNSSRQYCHRLAKDLELVGYREASEKVISILKIVGLPPSITNDYDDWLDDQFEDDLEAFDNYYFSELGCCEDLLWSWIKSNNESIAFG